MTENKGDRADALFQALADRTRRDILRRTLQREHSISDLAAEYDMSFAAVQKHVAVLAKAGLVTKRRRGREQLAGGDVTAVRSVAALLAEFEGVWRGRVERMDALLADEASPPDGGPASEKPGAADSTDGASPDATTTTRTSTRTTPAEATPTDPDRTTTDTAQET